MRISNHWAASLAAALALALAALLVPALAEVTSREPAPRAEPTIPPRPVHQRLLHLQCWQEGVKIIDQTELQGLALSAATRTSTTSFKLQGENQPSIFLLPFNDGMCLIQPMR